MKMGRKGSAFAWLVILIAIFAIGLVYMIFTNVFVGMLIPYTEAYLSTVTYPNGTAVNITDATATINLIKLVWNAWPLIAIIGLIVVGFVMAQRREPGQYY